MKVPAPPDDLSIASQAAWAGLAADVAVVNGGAAIDYILLADVCRARDRLAAMARPSRLTV